MLVIIGKSGSGKDELANRLVKDYGFKKIVTYTTRPPRPWEIPEETYHYISDTDFNEKIDEGFFAEWKPYPVYGGVWYYGSAKQDYEDSDAKTAIILSPKGLYKVRSLGYDVKAAYIVAKESTLRERLVSRGDDENEIDRRMKQDEEDFFRNPSMVKIFHNDEGSDIGQVASDLASYALEGDYYGWSNNFINLLGWGV